MPWPRLIGSISKNIFHLSLSVGGYIAAEYSVLCTGTMLYLGRQGPWGRQMSGFLFFLYALYSVLERYLKIPIVFVQHYFNHKILYSTLLYPSVLSSIKILMLTLYCTALHCTTLLYYTLSYLLWVSMEIQDFCPLLRTAKRLKDF